MYLDPIAELITKINNGRKAHKAEVSFATSKLKTAILELLVKEGYIKSYDIRPVSYTHLTLPTKLEWCRSRWSPYH